MLPLGIADRLDEYDASLRKRLAGKIVCGLTEDELDAQDQDLVIDVLVMRTALLYDLASGRPTYHTSEQQQLHYIHRVIPAWTRTTLGLTTLDVERYADDWKVMREILTSQNIRLYAKSMETEACCEAFKRLAAGRINYKWILNSVISIIECGGTAWFWAANQWVTFDSKVNLRSLDLTSVCCTDYLDFETELSEFSDTSYLKRFQMDYDRLASSPLGEDRDACDRLRLLRSVAVAWFADFNICDYPYRPVHGRGATAEVQGIDCDWWHKNRRFAVDEDIIHYLRHRCQESEWRNNLYVPYRGLDRVSELRCVPKSMTKNRTISMEPTTLQFLQQDVFLALDEYFSAHPEFGIDLHDQKRSRDLALMGSSDGSYATIDLSNASDSVTTDLIEFLFDGLPILLPLFATRSTATHVVDSTGQIDRIVPLKKFAPMGSALCFPVETAVFAMCCEVAVRRCSGRRSRRFDFVVYGDDIVIRSAYASELIQVLTLLGFKVNESKSFYDRSMDGSLQYGVFREACGIEALDGAEITPLRLSRRLVSPTNNDSSHLAGQGVGLVDLVNRAFLHGFYYLRRWLNNRLNRYLWYRTALRLPESHYREFALACEAGKPSWIPVAIPFVITDDYGCTNWRAFRSRNNVTDNAYHEPLVEVTVAVTRDSVDKSQLFDPGKPGQESDWSRLKRFAGRARARLRRYHLVRFDGPDDFEVRIEETDRFDGSLHDDNDLFSWWLKVGRGSAADSVFEVDGTGIVTIRTRDLKWSKQWVRVIYPAHPTFSSCPRR